MACLIKQEVRSQKETRQWCKPAQLFLALCLTGSWARQVVAERLGYRKEYHHNHQARCNCETTSRLRNDPLARVLWPEDRPADSTGPKVSAKNLG